MAWTTSGAIWWSAHALLPAGGERVHLLVGGEAVGAEAAEEPHHRQVELAVAAVGGGVDQPAAAVDVDEPVAGPQVAVQPGRRLGGAADLAQAVGVEPLEPGDGARRAARGRRGRAGRGAPGAGWRRTRPRWRTARSAGRGCRSSGGPRGRTSAGVAWWSAASARPSSASVSPRGVPELDPRRARGTAGRRPSPSDTASTSGTRDRAGLRQPAQARRPRW